MMHRHETDIRLSKGKTVQPTSSRQVGFFLSCRMYLLDPACVNYRNAMVAARSPEVA